MGGSRGSGQMRIAGDMELKYRRYDGEAPALEGDEKPNLFGSQAQFAGMTEIIAALKINSRDDLLKSMKREAAI
jgi:hypothetical protein